MVFRSATFATTKVKMFRIITQLFLNNPIRQVYCFYRLLRYKLGSLLKFQIWNITGCKNGKIFSRSSCFGLEVLEQLNLTSSVFNIQKGRIDFLIGTHSKIPFMGDMLIANFLKRKDIIYFILSQNYIRLNAINKPSCIFMDSYSELSDFVFTNKKEGWSFAANYFDIDHGSNLKSLFQNGGLLPINELKDLYTNYFSKLREIFPDVPIVFLHMPSILEKRKEFIQRNSAILEIINSIKDQYLLFYSIDLDYPTCAIDEIRNRQDPYHFDEYIYESVADLIRSKKIHALISSKT